MTGELTTREMEEVLRSQIYGYLGLAENNDPYVIPVTYVYSGGALYSHTYEGKKMAIARHNPRACLQVTDIRDFSNWRSVLCRGIIEELKGDKATHAIELLITHLEQQPDARGVHLPFRRDGRSHASRGAQEHPIVYRLIIEEKTGRFEGHDDQGPSSTAEALTENIS